MASNEDEGFLTQEQRKELRIAVQNAETLPLASPRSPTGGTTSTQEQRMRDFADADAAGSKGTLGKLIDTDVNICLDQNDPDYDSGGSAEDYDSGASMEDYDSGEEPYELPEVEAPVSTSLEDCKLSESTSYGLFVPIIKNYFSNGNVKLAASDLKDLGCDDLHRYFVKKLVSMAMGMHDKEKEMASVLLSFLYGNGISSTEFRLGFELLLKTVDDLAVDILDVLALFIARAVVDDILPPAFLSNAKVSLSESSKGLQVVQIAEKSYLSAPHHAELIERRWGSSTHITVEEVNKSIADLLKEYIKKGDTAEACRCIRELAVPFSHHEVVKQALTLGMESAAAEALIVKLLKEASEECLISSSQMMKGFSCVAESLDDLILDIPSAKSEFQLLVLKAISEAWLDSSYVWSDANRSLEDDVGEPCFRPEVAKVGLHSREQQHQQSVPDPATKQKPCSHEVFLPGDYKSATDEEVYGTVYSPAYIGKMAKQYPFNLDHFQILSISCLERRECLLVSAHTSAGKTVVAEYAVAMAFRDNQRVIYTSPIKALSNKKYRELKKEFPSVGLMTGDVTVNPGATCLVMTTEILRAWLCSNVNMMEFGWVIFDEVHYMDNPERGLIWEESIILMPPKIGMIFLSATLSNGSEFAEWASNVHKRPCHVIYTEFRPTPLEHFAFPIGSSQFHLIADENCKFIEESFVKVQGLRAKQHNDIQTVLKLIMEQEVLPVIFFSFTRNECDNYVKSIGLDLLKTKEEKKSVDNMIMSALEALNEGDRNVSCIEWILPFLRKGIGAQHSGLPPVIRELVEQLFHDGLVKVLFATETLAMGVNLPAKTVVFTSVEKWDGENKRYIRSGEYRQMSGRAGRRGKDSSGISVLMINNKIEMNVIKEMVSGKPAPLLSAFRLSYCGILKLMTSAGNEVTAEHVIRKSFLQFQYEKASPSITQRIRELGSEESSLDSDVDADCASYHNLLLDIHDLEMDILSEIVKPEAGRLVPGRLVKVRDGSTDWGWGVIASKVKTSLPPALAAACHNKYTVDTWVSCSIQDASSQQCSPPPRQKSEMIVMRLPLSAIYKISRIRIGESHDMSKQLGKELSSILHMHGEQYPDGIPEPHPIKDLKIECPKVVGWVTKLEVLREKRLSHPYHKSGQGLDKRYYTQKAAIRHEIKQLRSKTSDFQMERYRDELRKRQLVLKKLHHVDDDNIVQSKGQAASLIDSGDELLVTETLFNGTFRGLEPHQIAAVASCFVPCDSTSQKQHFTRDLEMPLMLLMKAAQDIAQAHQECGIYVDVDEYIISSSNAEFVHVIYKWSQYTGGHLQ